jgi:broad specificity phosphatase PhoE
MPTFWFVRHGESLAQLEQWDGPDHAVPLSPLGERQADALAEALAALPVERVLVSPFLRARQTAERAARLLEQEHEVVEDLRERFAGSWITVRGSKLVDTKLALWEFQPPHGESILQAATRAIKALHELETEHNTAVFAHGRVLAGVLALLDELDLGEPIEALDNCVIYAREIQPGHWARLLESLGS